LGRISIRRDFAITLNLEKLIFISIGVIMLSVIVYALGVEKGKAVAARETSDLQVGQPPQKAAPTIMSAPLAQKTVPTAAAAEAAAARTMVTGVQAAGTVRQYTVLAATFKREDAAIAEAARLKKEGFDAFVRPSGIYFQVCAGSYPTRAIAEKASMKVKRIYRDAYVMMK
jgi:cell division septation protein DedD